MPPGMTMRMTHVECRSRPPFRRAAATVGCLLLLAASSVHAVDESNLTFYGSFDKDFKADVSRERNAPLKVVGEPKIVDGRFGKALEVANGKDGLVFSAKGGNLPMSEKAGVSSRGTISFWMTPVDWDIGSAKNLYFGVFETEPQRHRGLMNICVPGPESSSMGLFAWPEFNPATPEALPAGGWSTCFGIITSLRGEVLNDATVQLRPGTWYHMVFTWRQGELRGYANGRPLGKMTHGEVNLGLLGTRFFIGAGDWDPILFCQPGCYKVPGALAGRATPWRYLVDDFAVFNVDLKPPQVLKLYQNAEGALAYAKSQDVSGACNLEFYSYISRERLDIKFNVDLLESVLAAAKAQIEIRKKGAAGNSAPVLTATIPWNADGGRFEGEIDTARLPREILDIRAVVVDGAGKEIARSDTQRYNRSKPVWEGNNYGKADYVPAPWTPLKTKKGTTEVWGRAYAYGKDLTLKSIQSQDGEILAAPMRLWMKEGGKQVAFKPEEKSRNRSPAGTRDTRQNTGRLGSFPAKVTAVTEFDGFVIWDLEISPAGEKPIDELILEIPLSREHAKYFYTPASRNAQVPTNTISGAFPNDGGFNSGGCTDLLQFNDAKVGFQWCMSSTEHWSNLDEHKQINVIPRDGEVAIQLRMIDKPTVLNKPARYRFFFEALPVKPLSHPFGPAAWSYLDKETKTAWDFVVPESRRDGFTYEGYAPGVRRTGLSVGGGHFGGFCYSADATPEEIAKHVWKDDDKPKPVPASGQYHGNYHFMGTYWTCDSSKPYDLTEEGDVYGSDWAMQSGMKPEQKPWGCGMVCPGETFRDHFAFWIHDRMMRGDSTIYYDHGSGNRQCVNIGHGHGWKDEKGVIHPYAMVLEWRELYMRAYKALKEVRPFNAMITHTPASRRMYALAFTDKIFDAESVSAWSDRVRARAQSGGYWSGSLPFDWMMAQFYPPVLGVPVEVAFQLGSHGSDIRLETLSPKAVYYSDPPRSHMPDRMKIVPFVARDIGAINRQVGNISGIAASTYPVELARNFVCADAQKAFTGQGDLKIAYWPVKEAGNRVLVTVGNFGFEPQDKEITVDVAKLVSESGSGSVAFPAKAVLDLAYDIETGEALPLTGKNRFRVNVGKKDYRDLGLSFAPPRAAPFVKPKELSAADANDPGIKLELWKDLKPEFQKLADKRDSYLYDFPLVPRVLKLKRASVRAARAEQFQQGDPSAVFGLEYPLYAWPETTPPYQLWSMKEVKKTVKNDEQKAFGGLDGLKVVYWTGSPVFSRCAPQIVATLSNLGTADRETEVTVNPAQLITEAGKKNLSGYPWKADNRLEFVFDVETGEVLPITGDNSFKVKVRKGDYRNLFLSWQQAKPATDTGKK